MMRDFFRDDPEARSALYEAVKRGVRVTLAVHSYLTPEEIKLGSQGKIGICYLPQRPTMEFVTNDRGESNIFDGSTVTTAMSEYLSRHLIHRLKHGRDGGYTVPPGKIYRFDSLLQRGRPPEEIIAYLQEEPRKNT